MKYIKIILFAVVLFILVVFAHYNQTPTSLVFLSYGGVTYQSVKLPLFAFFFIAILITIIVMSLLEVIERTSLRIKNRKLQKENTKLQTELTSYKEPGTAVPAVPDKKADRSAPAADKTETKGPAAKKKK